MIHTLPQTAVMPPALITAKGQRETSPLRAVFQKWERRLVWALMRHWREKTDLLTNRLERERHRLLMLQTQMTAGKGLLTDDWMIKQAEVANDEAFWAEWVGNYDQLVLPFIEEAVELGGEAGDLALQELGLGVSWDMANVEAGRWAANFSNTLVRKITETDRARLRQQLSTWTQTAETFPDLVKRVNKVVQNRPRARMIAATESTRCYAQGNIVTWNASGYVTGKVFYTAVDELVCPICGPLEGKVFELNAVIEHPDPVLNAQLQKWFGGMGGQYHDVPLHVNCRCGYAPWTGAIEPPGTQVPGWTPEAMR